MASLTRQAVTATSSSISKNLNGNYHNLGCLIQGGLVFRKEFP